MKTFYIILIKYFRIIVYRPSKKRPFTNLCVAAVFRIHLWSIQSIFSLTFFLLLIQGLLLIWGFYSLPFVSLLYPVKSSIILNSFDIFIWKFVSLNTYFEKWKTLPIKILLTKENYFKLSDWAKIKAERENVVFDRLKAKDKGMLWCVHLGLLEWDIF